MKQGPAEIPPGMVRVPPAIWLLLGGAAALHLVQLAGPFRLNTDAIRFLYMASEYAATAHFPPEQLPPGYPIAVALLVRLGLASPFSLALLNLVCFGVGLLAWASVAQRSAQWPRAAVLTGATVFLMSWLVVKHAPIPLSEPVFFALSGVCLWCGSRARVGSDAVSLGWWLASLGLAIAALFVRSIGIALVLACMIAAGADAARRLREKAQPGMPPSHRAFVAAGAALVFGIGLGGILIGIQDQSARPNSYWSNVAFANGSFGQTVSLLRTVLVVRLTEIGEIALNLPERFLPAAARAVFVLVGGSAAALALLGIARARARLLLPGLYVLGYAGVLVAWPSPDPRFWLPLLPWLYLMVVEAVPAGLRAARFRRAWLITHIGFGALAFAFSTRLTFSGTAFVSRYTQGTLRASYEAAWKLPPTTDVAPDELAVRVLAQYATPPPVQGNQ